MKKLLSILLVIALLLPMGTVTHAASAGEKPFYLTTWLGNYEGDYSNVYVMPYLWTSKAVDSDTLNCNSWNGVSDIEKLAQKIKEEFDARPEGTRYINFCMVQTAFHELVEDAFFVDKAIPYVQEWVEAFCKEYKSIGGKLDGLICDLELINMYAYYIYNNLYVKDNTIYAKIVANPIYKNEIRP